MAPALFACARCGTYACRACAASDRECQRCVPVEPRRTKWWQGTLTVLVVGIGAQVAGIIVGAITLVADAVARGDLMSLERQSRISFGLLAPALVATGLVMAFGSLLLPRLARVPAREALGLRGAPWPAFVAAPIGMLGLVPTSDLFHQAIVRVAPDFTFGALEQLDAAVRSAPVWLVAPMVSLIPGISEEVLFRGAFQRSIRRTWLAIVLSGVVFSLYHTDPHHVVAVLPLGLYLAWLGARSDSLYVPIVAHVVNNATAVVATAVLGAGTDEPLPIWFVPLGLGVTSLAIAIVWWSTRPKKSANELHVEQTDLGRAVDPNPEG